MRSASRTRKVPRVMDLFKLLANWIIQTPWYILSVLYFLGSIFFGSINKRIQRWRCLKATDCRNWKNNDGCAHTLSGTFGYVAWPIFVPMTVIYTLVESHPIRWFKKVSESRDLRKKSS